MKRVFPVTIICGLMVALLLWNARPHARKPDSRHEPATLPNQPTTIQDHRPTRSQLADQTLETPWASIESTDLTQLISNLRDIGCPEQTIRDLVTFRVCRAYEKRIFEEYVGDNYTNAHNAGSQRECRLKCRQLRADAENDLESLLGVSIDKLRASAVGLPEPQESILPLEKRKQIREVTERYERLIDEASREAGPAYGFYGDATADATIETLNEQKDAELAQLLTPSELKESESRNAADYVLKNLPEARSESEFKTMVRIVKEIGITEPKLQANRYGLGPINEDKQRELEEKRAQLETRLRQTFGEARYGEMQRNEQIRFAEIRREAARRGN